MKRLLATLAFYAASFSCAFAASAPSGLGGGIVTAPSSASYSLTQGDYGSPIADANSPFGEKYVATLPGSSPLSILGQVGEQHVVRYGTIAASASTAYAAGNVIGQVYLLPNVASSVGRITKLVQLDIEWPGMNIVGNLTAHIFVKYPFTTITYRTPSLANNTAPIVDTNEAIYADSAITLAPDNTYSNATIFTSGPLARVYEPNELNKMYIYFTTPATLMTSTTSLTFAFHATFAQE